MAMTSRGKTGRQSKGNKSRYVIKVMKVTGQGKGVRFPRLARTKGQRPKDVPGLFIGALN